MYIFSVSLELNRDNIETTPPSKSLPNRPCATVLNSISAECKMNGATIEVLLSERNMKNVQSCFPKNKQKKYSKIAIKSETLRSYSRYVSSTQIFYTNSVVGKIISYRIMGTNTE